MDTMQALTELGVRGPGLSLKQRKHLDEQGFIVLYDLFTVEETRTFAAEFDRLYGIEGDNAGLEVHQEVGAPRISDIFNKSTTYDLCLKSRPILDAAQHLLGEIKLHGANMREPLRGQGHQDLHSDLPKRTRRDWQAINALIAFDDIDAGNGAPRIVPKSHLWPPIISYPLKAEMVYLDGTPRDTARVPADRAAPYPSEVVVELPAGAAVLINGSLWHGGTQNVSGRRRRMLHLSFTRRDLPQQLVQQNFLTPPLGMRLTPALGYLLDITPTQQSWRTG
jgi:ectoine hydroxylase-related dioxygenase (phytanoyl-CoA dioxygenase family)